jgi:hypothetical protein
VRLICFTYVRLTFKRTTEAKPIPKVDLIKNNRHFDIVLQEERRRQAAAAADKRLEQEGSRGLKDPEGYKRKLEQREKLENQEQNQSSTNNGEPLRVIIWCQ